MVEKRRKLEPLGISTRAIRSRGRQATAEQVMLDEIINGGDNSEPAKINRLNQGGIRTSIARLMNTITGSNIELIPEQTPTTPEVEVEHVDINPIQSSDVQTQEL